MNTIIAIGAAAAVLVLLIIVGLKMAQKGGERRGAAEERAERLAESAERRAKADAARARPIPARRDLARTWARYRARRLRDSKSE